MKSDFEAWLRQQWPKRNDPYLRDCNDIEPQYTYQDQDTELAWTAWSAALLHQQQSDEGLIAELVEALKSVGFTGKPLLGDDEEVEIELSVKAIGGIIDAIQHGNTHLKEGRNECD